MQADGRAGCSRPAGSSTARCRRTTSRTSRRSRTRSTAQQREPGAPAVRAAARTRTTRPPASPAPTSSRSWSRPTGSPSTTPPAGCRAALPYLAELQPELFCEVSPELARRARPRARRLGDDRHRRTGDRGAGDGHRADARRCRSRAASCTRSVCPTTGAGSGSSPATRPTTCSRSSLDPNVHIQEVKAATCDIRPGAARAGRGAAGLRRRLPAPRRARSQVSRSRRTTAVGRPHTADEAQARVGLLHRHLDLHRLQGVRGRLQGVERASPTTA